MARIIAVCGKICSGKTYYANSIRERENAVILSVDEVTKELFDNQLGDRHDEMTLRIRGYLEKKSVEMVKAGCTVILDWGFWSRETRRKVSDFYRAAGIPCEWHYVEVDDRTWQTNIEERNERILSGRGGSDYYMDEGLLKKLLSYWEEPAGDEMDVWHRVERRPSVPVRNE